MKKRIRTLLEKCGLISQIGTDNDANRNEWLQRTLAEIPDGSRLLDAGAGELAQKKYCSHLDYVAQDFGGYDGVGDGAGLQTGQWDQSRLDIVCDITNIPEKDASFDAIMCVEVFEHLPDPIAALNEFSRLLKPGGWLILTAPFCSLTHFAPFHFFSGFNSHFYTHHLPEKGFEISEIAPNGNYYGYVAQEVRRTLADMSTHTDAKLGLLDKIASLLYLRTLNKMSSSEKNSHELLCYGYHVLAKKNQVLS